MFIKRLMFLLIITLGASTASAAIIKVEVNGIFASDADITSYSSPDTELYYSYFFDTNNMNILTATRVDSATSVTVRYQLGSNPMISFDSGISFLDGASGLIGIFEAPIGGGSFAQLNINSAVSPFIGSVFDLNFNLGTVLFTGGFYGSQSFDGKYTLSQVSPVTEVSAPPMLFLSLLAGTGVFVLRRRVKN